MKKKVEVKEVPSQFSQFGLGIQEDTKSDSDSDVVTTNTQGVPLNESIGFSESFLGNVLDDSNISDVTLSAINVSDLNGSGLAVNSSNVNGNRSSRIKNSEINYNELDATDGINDCDSDDDKTYIPDHEPTSKRPLVQDIVVAEIPPFKRKAGRPKGVPNAPKQSKGSKKRKGCDSPCLANREKPFVSRAKKPRIKKTKQNKSAKLIERKDIDDGENILKTPQKKGAENLDNSVIEGESGATSPIKKTHKKSRKRTRNPDNWFRQRQRRLKNSGQEHSIKNKKGEWVVVPAKKVGEPCTCNKKSFEKFTSEEINEVFKRVWKNGKYDLQNMYLCQVIECKKTKN